MNRMDESIELCWVIIGRELNRGFLGQLHYLNAGQTDKVEFAWSTVTGLEDQENSEVIGFLHTHPNTRARPSVTDCQTMQAWTCALGKSLICGIKGIDGLRTYLFSPESVSANELECIRFGNSIFVSKIMCETVC